MRQFPMNGYNQNGYQRSARGTPLFALTCGFTSRHHLRHTAATTHHPTTAHAAPHACTREGHCTPPPLHPRTASPLHTATSSLHSFTSRAACTRLTYRALPPLGALYLALLHCFIHLRARAAPHVADILTPFLDADMRSLLRQLWRQTTQQPRAHTARHRAGCTAFTRCRTACVLRWFLTTHPRSVPPARHRPVPSPTPRARQHQRRVSTALRTARTLLRRPLQNCRACLFG